MARKKKTYEELSQKIRSIFTKYNGGPQGADDCSQDLVMRLIEGKGQHQTIDHAVIDYLRRQNGRAGKSANPGAEQKQQLKRHSKNIDRVPRKSLPTHDPRLDLISSIDFESLLKVIDDQLERGILVLIVKWGMNNEEVADIFGLTASRISQILRDLQNRRKLISRLDL